MDDLKACSESSKSGSYKSSNFGWFTSMLRIIQKWIIQIIQFRMISSTFQFYIGNNRHISSKFGWYITSLINHPHLDDLCGSQIIHFWSPTLPEFPARKGSGFHTSWNQGPSVILLDFPRKFPAWLTGRSYIAFLTSSGRSIFMRHNLSIYAWNLPMIELMHLVGEGPAASATRSEDDWNWSTHENILLVCGAADHQRQAAHQQYDFENDSGWLSFRQATMHKLWHS